MKPRSREINIFNMSLLDVLCGALGAFCFMMLALFPYYKPNQSSNTNYPPPPGPPASCEECKQQHETMRRQVEQMERDLSATRQRNSQLEIRNPFVVEMVPRFSGFDVDLFLNDDRTGPGGVKPPQPDATKEQGVTFRGDRFDGGFGTYPEVWMVRDAPAGEYRVYYKVMKSMSDPAPPILIEGRVMNRDGVVYLPKVVASKPGQILHVATLTADAEGNLKVTPQMPSVDFDRFVKERDEIMQRQTPPPEERKKQQERKKDEQKKD